MPNLPRVMLSRLLDGPLRCAGCDLADDWVGGRPDHCCGVLGRRAACPRSGGCRGCEDLRSSYPACPVFWTRVRRCPNPASNAYKLNGLNEARAITVL